ncbi:MAG: 6-phosphofructokinase [Ruminococcus sp.]|nr:6-phosphofructokinase [Ruminococcus sp.]MBQ9514652.1 6-phosphofructokinase [Ruminococcus sp.]
MSKALAVLTSGGDAPGMNAAVRAVVRAGIHRGFKVYGISRGYHGLLRGEATEMNLRSVSDIIGRGGTLLYTARCKAMTTPEGQQKAADICKSLDIEGLVVIGGDGSFKGARALSNLGIPCVGIPGTIDNDIACSDYTIGFDTAMNTAMEMVDKIRDTAQSHDRCSVVEVMGRRCGDIALQTGIAVGATAILVPEIPHEIEQDVIAKIYEQKSTGKKHFIIVVAEGVGGVEDLAKYIEKRTGIESRATILGHVQRGGSPTLRDRMMATAMGVEAVDLLEKGIGNRVIAYKAGKIVNYDITEALDMPREFDTHLYEIAMEASI